MTIVFFSRHVSYLLNALELVPYFVSMAYELFSIRQILLQFVKCYANSLNL